MEYIVLVIAYGFGICFLFQLIKKLLKKENSFKNFCNPTFLHRITKPILIILILFACVKFVYDNYSIRFYMKSYDLNCLQDGTYSFLVKIDNGKKEYCLPSEISIYTNAYYVSKSGDREELEFEKIITLNKVFFNNGGYLNFQGHEIETGKKIAINDQNDNEWYCTLLNEHTFTERVKETKPNIKKDIPTLFVRLCSLMFLFAFVIRAEHQ